MTGRKVVSAPGAVFICLAGKASVSVNQKNYVFGKNKVMILFPDTVPYISDVSGDFSCLYIFMSRNFTDEVTARLPNEFFDFLFFNPVLTPSDNDIPLLEASVLIVRRFRESVPGQHGYVLMRNALESVFLYINTKIAGSGELFDYAKADRAQYVFREFWKLMVRYCPRERSVAFYADKLCINEDPSYMCRFFRKRTGMTLSCFRNNF